MVTPFNFKPIRAVGINLIKQFGRPSPCQILRAINGTVPDASKPWRTSAGSTLTFPFTGVVLPFVVKRAVETDEDTVIYAPGDIVDVKALEDITKLCGFIQAADNIQSNGVVYTIIGMHDLTPGADPILFNMRCKAWPSDTMTPVTQFSGS